MARDALPVSKTLNEGHVTPLLLISLGAAGAGSGIFFAQRQAKCVTCLSITYLAAARLRRGCFLR